MTSSPTRIRVKGLEDRLPRFSFCSFFWEAFCQIYQREPLASIYSLFALIMLTAVFCNLFI